ncbi:hypothetical protein ACFT25_15875 [Streptomyces hydrogenans]|uniref:hypothetical protein n=1 Tax=Streptomyces hydrogenans TaxID=1873719 RepID=UPI003641D758
MDKILDMLWSAEFGIALLGALVGGAFTMLGSWWQTRSSNKAAMRVQAQGHAMRGSDAITQLRVHLEAQTFQGRGAAETRAAWNRELQGHLVTARSAIMLLPDGFKGTRNPALAALREIKTFSGHPAWAEYKIATGLLLAEALKHLGMFVRGSEAPEERDMSVVVTKAIDEHKRERAQEELEQLNEMAEHMELTDEEKEEARKLRDYLGLPHPAAPVFEDPEATG